MQHAPAHPEQTLLKSFAHGGRSSASDKKHPRSDVRTVRKNMKDTPFTAKVNWKDSIQSAAE